MDGVVTTFGTTGYTYNNIFLLYDRHSNTVWYPLDDGAFDGIGGTLLGHKIPFMAKPPIMTLAEWQRLHPETLVLLRDAPPALSEETMETVEAEETMESDETVATVTVTDDA
ncbi:MAG: DUF3179 domain-containing protein [Planctomycetes bacterium]|nr:DUF3179 domain-containing protein [Planctomycetota bacterium]